MVKNTLHTPYHRSQPSLFTPLRLLLLVAFSLWLGSALSLAQNPDQLLDAGSTAYEEGDYENTITNLTQFIQKDKNSIHVPLARYLIGVSHYNRGEYEKAIPFLIEKKGPNKEFRKDLKENALFHLGASYYFTRKFNPAAKTFKAIAFPPADKKEGEKDKPAAEKSEEAEEEENPIRSFALFYLGRTLLEFGTKLNEELKKPEDAGRAWADAVKALETMEADYPDSPLIPDALMARGTVHVYQQDYKTAETALTALKNHPDGADQAGDADYLLGYVLTQQAHELRKEFKEAEAKAVNDKARTVYGSLMQSKNLLVANEAAFQLANLDLADKNYDAAIDGYRSLKSKEDLIASQEGRLKGYREQVAGAPAGKLVKLQRAIKREKQKLMMVKSNPELANEAWIKIGETYLQLREYNKARIVFRHAAQFAEPDQKKRLEVQEIITYAAQGNADKADQLFAKFRKAHPNDELAKSVKFLLGTAFMQQERYDEAKKAFNESLKEFPDSPNSAQIPKLLAQILVQQGKQDEAVQSFRNFIKDAEAGKNKVATSVIEDTKRQLGITLYQMEQHDEAVKILKDLAENAETANIKEESHLQVASILAQIKRPDEAVPMFQSFAETYPESASASKAAFQAASILEKQGKKAEALKAYEYITTKFPDSEVTVYAYDKVWRMQKDDVDKMIAAQDALMQAFPGSNQAMGALFDRAKHYEKKLKDNGKALETYQAVYDKYNSQPESERNARTANFASYSLVSTAMIKQKQATSIGNYSGLDDAQKKQWADLIQESGDLLLKVVKEFPGAKATSVALTKWVDVLLNRVGNKIIPLDKAMLEMSTLAGEMPTEEAKLQVMIAQAGMLNKAGQPGQALNIYEQAISQLSDKSIISWQDLSNYGDLLLNEKQWQKALDIFKSLDETTTDKNKHAKANATYGQGAALQGLGNTEEAGAFFSKLQKDYPWSPKIMEARYGTAVANFESGQFQSAVDVIKEIISSGSSSNESKAKAMILMARSLAAMGEKGLTTPETKQEDGTDMDIYDLACNYLAKVEVFYADALPVYSSEALYRAVGIRKKQGKDTEANELLDRLLQEYATTPWAQKGRKDY